MGDAIQLPHPHCFVDSESYAATQLHELIHWTKHPSRLDRHFESHRDAYKGYSREELVAELGAAFLCAALGVTPEPREDHAAYIGHWLRMLRDDSRAIFSAAAHAQRAVDFLQGLQPAGTVANAWAVRSKFCDAAGGCVDRRTKRSFSLR